MSKNKAAGKNKDRVDVTFKRRELEELTNKLDSIEIGLEEYGLKKTIEKLNYALGRL